MFVALCRKSTLCYMLLIIWEWTSERGRVCGPVSGNCLTVQYVPVGSCWVACIHTQCFFPYGPPVCLSYIKAAKIKTAWPQYQQLQHRVYKLTIFLCLKKKQKTLKNAKLNETAVLFAFLSPSLLCLPDSQSPCTCWTARSVPSQSSTMSVFHSVSVCACVWETHGDVYSEADEPSIYNLRSRQDAKWVIKLWICW